MVAYVDLGAALLLLAGFTYVVVDAVLGLSLGRCVLPGLRCRDCRREVDE